MHIPDGFLSANTLIPAWVVSIGGISYCIKKASLALKDKMIPLMGIMAAFVFAAQMLNFPVIGGTSGHLLGGVFAAVMLGPYMGAIVITLVLIVQCFVFQDGGVTALGANIFNMSIIGAMGGYVLYSIIKKRISGKTGILIGSAVAAWCSVVLASFFCSIELAISGTSPFKIVMPAMVFVHMLIGIGEALITTLVISFILKVRPDLVYHYKEE